jgi:hypothetical protein
MMKYLPLLLLFLFPASVQAQTPVNDQMAIAYYENCKSKPSPNMNAETQKQLCGCTAKNMKYNMSVEDVQAMGQDNSNARLAFNKMMTEVYAPCMDAPAKELYYKNCVNNPQTAALAKNPQVACNCMSTEVATYLAEEGPAIFRDILARNPRIMDPMAALADDPKFQQFAQQKLLACL